MTSPVKMTKKRAKELAAGKLRYGFCVGRNHGYSDGRPYVECPVCKKKVSTITNNHLGESDYKAITKALIEHIYGGCEV